ncbi:MAG TPA: DUF4160 domain-containing protein [Gemmatimonadaceae bacterium]|nr:DUF4160 domain-containing protein [Gemmatimonadaceae bacterium]
MPTVLEEDGFAIRIHLPPREHWPPHVHVIRGHGEVVVWLGDGRAPPSVREVYRMRDRDVVRAFRLVESHHDELLAAWRRYHG